MPLNMRHWGDNCGPLSDAHLQQVDTYMLTDEMKQKVDNLLFQCSRVVNCDKLLMKNARAVFSNVYVKNVYKTIYEPKQSHV